MKKLRELKSFSLKKNLQKLIQDVNEIYKSKENPNIIPDEDRSNDTKKIIMVQRAVRKFLNLINHKKTNEMYSAEFNHQFFSQMRLDKINELKNRILTKIKTNNIPHKNHELNFQEVILIICDLFVSY